MELLLLSAMLLLPLAYLSKLTKKLERRTDLLLESRALGLTEVKGRADHLQGRLRSYRVEIDARSPLEMVMTLTALPGRLPKGLEIFPLDDCPKDHGRSFETLDPALDNRLSMTTETPLALQAGLSSRTRSLMSALMNLGGLRFEKDRLRFFPYEAPELKPTLDKLTAIVDELCVEPEFIPHRLLRSALSDPLPAIRTAAAERLIQGFKNSVEANILVVHSAGDPDPGVRLKIALALHDIPTIKAMVKQQDVPPPDRLSALDALAPSEQRALLEGGLSPADEPPDFIEGLLERVVRLAPTALPWLPPLLGHLDDGVVARAAVALAAVGKSEDQSALYPLLERPAVRLFAIEALSMLGNSAALVELRPLTKHLKPEVRRAATSAVEEIINRGKFGPGRLSLSEPLDGQAQPQGRLSITDGAGDKGALSVVDKTEDQNEG